MLNPTKKQKVPFVTQKLSTIKGPVLSATDYMKIYSDQIREFVPDTYRVLGTDGFGRSDSREQLRHFFEVDMKFIAAATLYELQSIGLFDSKTLMAHYKKLGIDKNKANPIYQ